MWLKPHLRFEKYLNTVFPPIQVAASIQKIRFFRKSYLVELLNKMLLSIGGATENRGWPVLEEIRYVLLLY